ncbi:glycosyltransferase family protein [Mesohalobacter halotolerans]|uniref:Glycosyltransferase n=1 Tax=Mesohalobacter halotolerans TaxID=1883405 RepID=A0A4U5TQC0_9FLAO|nr:glycosyltransferase [Mesohalobacter halotolerans]MBS3738558.1 hypothetical protein [Psychroflexus sp.]TKS56387.1 glycosyltransferase [Mesohalobacter halotolerans]
MSKSNAINVLQLIDSLDAGGGERMSVHLANALSEQVNFSSLLASRRSGILEKDILPKVKIIWHDHYGYRHRTSIKQNLPLLFSSLLYFPEIG